MVRLGPAAGIATARRLASFQSHCGAIGTSGDHKEGGALEPFQSHCGAIGTSFSSPSWRWRSSFQSHCGAIGTLRSAGGGPPASFQSHCGAIGTSLVVQVTPRCPVLSIPLWCDWDLPGERGADGLRPAFNPTVVRLGRGKAVGRGTPAGAFNPTVVRLGHPPGFDWRLSGNALSIPLWCDWDPRDISFCPRCDDAFNPTVVRLGPGGESMTKRYAITAFNPTVVRLGRHNHRRCPAPLRPFQSHCGAIGTSDQHIDGPGVALFQSHCGAIGTSNAR